MLPREFGYLVTAVTLVTAEIEFGSVLDRKHNNVLRLAAEHIVLVQYTGAVAYTILLHII